MLPSVLFMFTEAVAEAQAASPRVTAASAGAGGTRSTPTSAGAGSVRT